MGLAELTEIEPIEVKELPGPVSLLS